MVENRNGKKVLITPVTTEDLADIHIGDIVYLDGDLVTCRDVAHRRLIEGKRELPVDLHGKAILHAGPIVRPSETAASGYEMVSVGPTTSMRMEKFEKEFVEQTGVKVIVGKGGMGPNTEYACKTFKAIHCVFPAGCAVVAATEVQRIAAHHWGEPGNSFYIQCPMAISSVTKYPDAAWDFVSTMIRQTNEDAESMYAFPISQEAFDKKMTAVMTEQYQLDENGEQVDWDEDGEPDKMSIGSYEVVENGESTWQEVYALTQEDIDQILSVINSATGIVDYDDEILSIVSDEVSAYFAGDKDVQTTANMIQSRVNLYVQEQR